MRNKFHTHRHRFARFRRVKIKRFKVLSRHPFAVPFIVFLVFGLIIGGGLLYARQTHQLHAVNDSQIVVISHDHTQQIVPTRAATVGSLLAKLQITLNQGDVVEPAAATKIDQDQFRINIYRAVPVAVVDNGHRSFTFSAATTPRSIAAQTGAKLYPDDLVSTNPAQDFIRTGTIGEEVVINRANPVNLNLYGTALAIRTHAATVGELVEQKNIKLAKDDQLIPDAKTPITANTQVFIVRNGVKIESVDEVIPKEVQRIQDATLAYGSGAVRQQGSDGHQVTTYQENLKNGAVVSRTVLQTVVTQPAVTQIEVIGTSLSGIKGDMALAGISPDDYDYVDYIISHESGWCPTKAQGEHYCPSLPDNSDTPNGYGLCQSTPGRKMASAGADWATNPVTQLRWCAGYAQGRYGSWGAAYNHWVNNHNW
jgi:uncharacterized protein YabE (DUF348 family)